MRGLWIEDFDGGKSGKNTIKKNLEEYFQLSGKNINKCTLEETLKYLERKSSWYEFDAVLIDIRFKVCEKEDDETEIYDIYFKDFLTKEKYDEYTEKLGGDANAASSGILLYLALIHRYNYNQKRIAFISANVDDTSDEFADINNMREFLYKAKDEGLDEDEKGDFSVLNEAVFELYKKKLGLNEEEAEKKFLPPTDEIKWDNQDDIDVLLKQIDCIETEMKKAYKGEVEKKDGTNLKYDSVKKEFEKVGLIVPRAFAKPGGLEEHRTKISWKFKKWVEEELDTDYYKLREYIVPICLEIISSIDNSQDHLLYQPYVRLVGDRGNADHELKETFSNIIDLFPANSWIEKDESLYCRIIKECVNLCESIPKPSTYQNDRYKYSCVSVLKLARNWSSHQGISGVTVYSVVFVYHILLNTFIDIDKNTRIKELDRMMIETFCEPIERLQYENVKNIIDKAEQKYRQEHKEAVEKFKSEASEEEVDKAERRGYKYSEKTLFYEVISGIGNEFSPIRKEVSMKHLYALFLDNMEKMDFDEKALFEHSVVHRIKN